MSKLPSGKGDEDTPGGDDREPGGGSKRPAWQTGHMPRMPRAASDDEPDWVSGWFHERLLDGLFEDRSDDQERPEHDASQTGQAE